MPWTPETARAGTGCALLFLSSSVLTWGTSPEVSANGRRLLTAARRRLRSTWMRKYSLRTAPYPVFRRAGIATGRRRRWQRCATRSRPRLPTGAGHGLIRSHSGVMKTTRSGQSLRRPGNGAGLAEDWISRVNTRPYLASSVLTVAATFPLMLVARRERTVGVRMMRLKEKCRGASVSSVCESILAVSKMRPSLGDLPCFHGATPVVRVDDGREKDARSPL